MGLDKRSNWIRVRRVLEDTAAAVEAGGVYDPHAEARDRGRKRIIKYDSEQAKVVLGALHSGLGLANSTLILNIFRQARGLPAVSYITVQRFVCDHPCVEYRKRRTKKSGKDDNGSDWAKARLILVKQLQQQLDLGEAQASEGSHVGTPADTADLSPHLPPLSLDKIAFWDEHHKKVRLGHASKWEMRYRLDENGGLSRDGELEPDKPTTSVKYPGEARGCFGVAMVSGRGNGMKQGKTLPPFNYTGKKVVGVKTWNKAKDAELNRVLNLRVSWGPQGHGYKERFPETWQQELEAQIKKKLICVTDIMDHVVQESTKAFKGSTHEHNFFIYHDALSAWWEPEAQKHMKELGFADRQIRSLDPEMPKRYRGKLVGDSPELCRGLDSHGFADLDRSMTLNASLAKLMPEDHPAHKTFNMGTPGAVWSCMVKTWMCSPTSSRIIEDIEHLPEVLDKIIAAEGCVVQDEFLRTGRRARAAEDQDSAHQPSTRKIRQRQRKETLEMPPIHPDLLPAWKKLTQGSGGGEVGCGDLELELELELEAD